MHSKHTMAKRTREQLTNANDVLLLINNSKVTYSVSLFECNEGTNNHDGDNTYPRVKN